MAADRTIGEDEKVIAKLDTAKVSILGMNGEWFDADTAKGLKIGDEIKLEVILYVKATGKELLEGDTKGRTRTTLKMKATGVSLIGG